MKEMPIWQLIVSMKVVSRVYTMFAGGTGYLMLRKSNECSVGQKYYLLPPRPEVAATLFL